MSKILILVLSYNDGVYGELMRTQQTTWGSVEVEGVRTVYYHGGLLKTKINGPDHIKHGELFKSWERIEFDCTDSYYYMAAKFKMCLDYVKDWDYDVIFRTNSSSYVNKQRLKEFAATLPTEKLYAGWTFVDSEDHGGLCVSGAGIFLSRDTVQILRDQIDPMVEREEDVEIGRILRRNGIVAIDDKSRIDYHSDIQQYTILYNNPYHIRFKTGNRLNDANNMRLVHQKII